MSTDTPILSPAGRNAASPAARPPHDIDPLRTSPTASHGIVDPSVAVGFGDRAHPTDRADAADAAVAADSADALARAGMPAGSAASMPDDRPTDLAATAPESDSEGLTPLFQPLEAQGFRDAWNTVQVGFVDDPQGAVHQADELVSLVMQSLGESFASERARLEGQARTEQASTEDLRVALRRYRSFLQRLLAF